MSEESDDENMFLLFVGVGIANLGLGAPDLVLNDSSQLSSWLFVVAGVLFFISAFTTRYKDSDGSQDWI